MTRSLLRVIWTFLICLLSFQVFLPTARAQTVLGQTGTLISPSADTYLNGNFMMSGYFSSMSYSNKRYDTLPFGFIVGLSPYAEIGFSFPGLWEGAEAPGFMDGIAQLSLKYRFMGDNNGPWRLAAAVILQRESVLNLSNAEENPTFIGFEIISSHIVHYDNHLSFFLGSVGSDKVAVRNRNFMGAGYERFISKPLQFTGDIVTSARGKDFKDFSLQALIGIRYYVYRNVHVSAGGGIGMSTHDLDWRYMIGMSLTSDIKKATGVDDYGDLYAPPSLELLDESIPPVEIEPEEPPEPEPEPFVPEITPFVDELIVDESSDEPKELIIAIPTEVLFDLGSADLKPEAYAVLRDAVKDIRKELEQNPDAQIRVEGYTDNLPIRNERFQSNWELSAARAISVVKYLIEKEGFQPARLQAMGYGEYNPVVPNDSPENRQKNRRVEIKVVKPLSSSVR